MTHNYYPGRRYKRRYAMDYIPDPQLFKAVMFALQMMREGKPPAVASTVAADYYDFPVSDVAHYTGQAAGNAKKRRRQQ
jgi:hypothetical protein